MEKVHFTTKAANYIKGKYFTKTEVREINGSVKEEINELYVETHTSAEIYSQGNNVEEPETLTELQHCILIPSYASRIVNEKGNTEWLARVRGWAYGTKQSRKKKLVMGMVRHVAGVNKDDEKCKLLEDRISMFLARNLRNQRYKVQIVGLAHPSHMELDRDPDDANFIFENMDSSTSTIYQDLRPSTYITSNTGHFCGTISIPVDIVNEWVINAQKEGYEDGNHVRLLKLVAMPEENQYGYVRTSYGSVNLIEMEGISVISDIDDTIKFTEITSGPRVALSNTFLYDLREVPGMAEVYMDWYNKGASIHYVSNSPWQLFPMLKQFFHTKRFPPGSAHLKFYNDLVKSLLKEPGLSKSNYITEIFEDFPNRKFILVGDSGETDMEIYSKIANMYPKQILHVFIRDVSTERLKNLPTPPASSSRSFPFISRSSSSTSINTRKTMPPAIDTSICNIVTSGTEEAACSPIEYKNSPEILTPTTPIPKTPLQKFFDRVEACKTLIPNNAFTLFKDGQELRENEIVNKEFELLLEKQRQRPSRQNTTMKEN